MDQRYETRGFSARKLRLWGTVLLAAGMAAVGVLQRGILGVGTLTGAELLERMQNSDAMMMTATAALLLQALETCAVPIFAFLTVEAVLHAQEIRPILTALTATALLSEVPYDFLMTGKLFVTGSQNPAFALVLAAILLYFFQRYEQSSLPNTMIKLAVLAAALFWCAIVRIQHGYLAVLLSAVLWAMRERPLYRGFAGIAVSMLCCVFSPFYLASPMAFLLIHFYNGEQEEQVGLRQMLFYPVLLILTGLAAACLA